MKNQKGFTLIETMIVVYIFVIVVVGVGWIKNVIKFVRCDFKSPYKAEIIHCAGLFPPIGAVVGWLNIKDNQTLNVIERSKDNLSTR